MPQGAVFALAEVRNGRVHPVSFEILARGAGLADKSGRELVAVLMGHGLNDDDARELTYHGAERVIAVDHPALENFVVESHAEALAFLIDEFKPEIMIAAATTTGRTLMPYTAVKAQAGLTADCTELDIDPDSGRLLQTRPAIGGNILATIQTPEARPQMCTVRPRSTKPLPRRPERSGIIERVTLPEGTISFSRTKWLSFTPDSSQGVTIQDAGAVVAGGRGIGKGENFELLFELAGLLNAAVGASRDAVDRGWIGYPHQVGLSGKTVSPRLYLACGISGSVQHVAGMQTSETVVAINKDPDAQIFRMANYGIVGDLHEILPALIAKLRERRSAGVSAR